MTTNINSSQLEVRYWSLCLLAAAESAGLCPITKERFHSYFFLANALAPTYGELGVVGVVMKLARGPYYPELDWHLTRLCIQGFAAAKEFKITKDKLGAWTHADFTLTKSGAGFVTALKNFPNWKQRFDFFTDVATGLARLLERRIDTAIQSDDTYARPGITNHQVTRFFDAESNYSIQSIDRLREVVPEDLNYSRQDLLRTYAKLLDLKAA